MGAALIGALMLCALGAPVRADTPLPPIRSELSSQLFINGEKTAALSPRWPLSTPINWTVDPANIKASGAQAPAEIERWQRVIGFLAQATGYRFNYVPVRPGQAAHVPGAVPTIAGINVVITYENGDQRPGLLAAGVIAEASLTWLETPADASGWADRRAVAGAIIMDYPDLGAQGCGRWMTLEDRVGLMAHEYGHVMGLGHSSDPRSVMFPYWLAGRGDYTASDRLALVDLAGQSRS
jgi:hypothetical protein